MADDPDPSLGDAFAEARPKDPAALALARARVGGALFGELAPGFGRFRVLERLGHGGMGVVYAAYDPQLDRGVALKMIEVGERDRDAALAEAKALAKLAHPNVVPVFDVGLESDRVYIVMELVHGKTLREWCKDRPASAIIDAYRQAGAGLVAAHAAALIHRDFKPDNAIVGDDDRVRVVDFGLACEANAATGRGAGTPAYMAPEQKTDAITPAVDQFSFCTSLAESLGNDSPRWVAAIIERGRAEKPEDRFPSMQALVRELGRDPARIARRRIIAVLGFALVVALVLLARSRSASVEICGGGTDEIEAAWPGSLRAIALGRIAGLGAYGKEIGPKLTDDIAAHAKRWASAHRGACLDHRRGVQSDDVFDRRMLCLERGRVALSEVGRVAMSSTSETLAGVALAVASLPDPVACADRELLATSILVPPANEAARVAAIRGEIERARVLVTAGEFVKARASLGPVIAQARALAFRPALAEALLVDGQAAMKTDAPTSALAPLREATTLAFGAGAPALGIEAWARRAYVEGNFDNVTNALAGADVVDAIAASVPTAHFARALLANNLGSLAWLAGRHDDAMARIASLEKEASYVTGPGAIELLVARSNTILMAEDPRRVDAQLTEIVAELTGAVGAKHPLTLRNRYKRATITMSSARDALLELEPTCAAMDSDTTLLLPAANCWAEIAEIRDSLGDRSGAITAARHAMRATLPDVYPELPGYLAWWNGDGDDALRLLSGAAREARPDPAHWYSGFHRAKIDLATGRVLSAMGHVAEGRALLIASLATLSSVPIRETTIVRRYRAQAAITASGSP